MKRKDRESQMSGAIIPTKMMKNMDQQSSTSHRLSTRYADQLEITTEGKTLLMSSWTRHYADYFYPDSCGDRTVRVPAVYFNHENIRTPEQAVRKHCIPRLPSSLQVPSVPSPSSSSSPSRCYRSCPCCSSASSSSSTASCSSSCSSSSSSTPLSTSPNPCVLSLSPSLMSASSSTSTLCELSRDEGLVESRELSKANLGNVTDGDVPSMGQQPKLAKVSIREDRTKEEHSLPGLSGDTSVIPNVSERQASASEVKNKSVSPASPKFGTKNKNHAQHCQPVQLMCPPQESTVRRDKAMKTVLEAFENLGKDLERRRWSDGKRVGGGGLFIISGVNYDNYLNRIPTQVVREACEKVGDGRGGGFLGNAKTSRGVLDILVLQEHVGLILIQVKSVGGNTDEWRASDSEMEGALRSVLYKVKEKSHELTTSISQELLNPGSEGVKQQGDSDTLQPVHVLALPFIPRRLYQKLCKDDQDFHDFFDVKIICKEDLEDSASCPGWIVQTDLDFVASFQPPTQQPVSTVHSPATQSSLYLWWKKTFLHTHPRLTKDKIKEVVGSICGVFSTFTAQPDTKCRSEVRTFGHSVSETAARFADPCLTFDQYSILQRQDRYLALSGPPGSGKTMLLILKAVQWLEQEKNDEDDNAVGTKHIVVVGLRRGPTTTTATAAATNTEQPPHIRALQEAIEQRTSGTDRGRLLLNVTYNLNAISLKDIEQEVAKTASCLMEKARESVTKEGRGTRANGLIQRDQLNDGEIQEERNANTNSSEVKEKAEVKTIGKDSCVPDWPSQKDASLVDLDTDDSLHKLTQDAVEAAADEKAAREDAALCEVEETSDLFKYDSGHYSRLKMREKIWTDTRIVSDAEDGSENNSAMGEPDVDLHSKLNLSTHSSMSSSSSRDNFKDRFHFVVSDVDPNDEKTDRLLQTLIEHPQACSVWWSTSEPPETTPEGAWSLCRVEELNRVTRRPPRVQRVLREVEHRDRWKEAYVSCSAEFGLPTDGPPVVCIQHTAQHYHAQETSQARNCDVSSCVPPAIAAKENEHLQQPHTKSGGDKKHPQSTGMTSSHEHLHSIFGCKRCSEATTDFISYLMTDSINPKLSPFFAGFTKFLKDRSKNKFGTPIRPQDILIVTCYHDEPVRSAGLPETSAVGKEAKNHELVNSPLVRRIRSRIPLKVLTKKADSEEEKVAFPKNCAVLTDASNVHGLERMIVIYVARCDDRKLTSSPPPEQQKPDCLIHTCKTLMRDKETGISGQRNTKDSNTALSKTSKHVHIEHPTNQGEKDSISVRIVSPVETSDSLSSSESESSDHPSESAEVLPGGSFSSNTSSFVSVLPGTVSIEVPSVKLKDRRVKIASTPHVPFLSKKNAYDGIRKDAKVPKSVDKSDHTIPDGAEHSQLEYTTIDATMPEHGGPENKSINREEPDSTPTTMPANVEEEEKSLPRWLKQKKDLIEKRKAVKRGFLRELDEQGAGCCAVRKKPRSLDDLLQGLSDVNRRGLYAAASCCLSQLVILTM